MLIVYGKHKNEKRYSPMDMNMGQPVRNLIYAAMYDDSKKTPLQSS